MGFQALVFEKRREREKLSTTQLVAHTRKAPTTPNQSKKSNLGSKPKTSMVALRKENGNGKQGKRKRSLSLQGSAMMFQGMEKKNLL